MSSPRVTEQLAAAIADWQQIGVKLAEPTLAAAVEQAGQAVHSALDGGHSLLVAGNGGSAAIASHVAAEFLGKCIADRRPLPAINLAESPTSLTAIGNDYGFDAGFVRGIEAWGRPGDVFLGMSTSGTSANVLLALAAARASGLITILMTGTQGAGQREHADHLLVAPSASTPRIQEVHLMWAHAWCEAVDLSLA